MSVYEASKLIQQARQLAADYRRTMGKPLPGISNEIAEHDAMHLLRLKPAPKDAVGYEAIDPERGNKRIQIKSRTIFDESKSGQRMGQIKLNQDWDSVVLVLMDENYEPYEIYEAEREEIKKASEKVSANRAKRGALSVARFKVIGDLIWTREDGLEPDEVWSNY